MLLVFSVPLLLVLLLLWFIFITIIENSVSFCRLPYQLTSLMSEIGLNIQEAHAYSTSDGYSLDVFVVDGWEPEVSFLSLTLKHGSKPFCKVLAEGFVTIS